MKAVSAINELRSERIELTGSVGLVPTMGYLHEGHLSLVRAAKKNCEHIVVSIFVNPTQFGPNEDFKTYPRDLSADLALLAEEEVDLVWIPEKEELFPEGYKTYIEIEGLSGVFEGASRPGHFKGVATVVAKLFLAVLPDKAYFGQKDAQQVAVLKTMTRDLNFPVELVICPTLREPDGLAMSSRNSYLNIEERKAALVLSRGLQSARTAFEQGEKNGSNLTRLIKNIIEDESLACMDYVACVDMDTFERVDLAAGKTCLILAVNIGYIRLIDNVLLL